jgi:hypothetical protein
MKTNDIDKLAWGHEFDKIICELSDWLQPRSAYKDALASDDDKTQMLKILRAIICPDYFTYKDQLQKEYDYSQKLESELSKLKQENAELKETYTAKYCNALITERFDLSVRVEKLEKEAAEAHRRGFEDGIKEGFELGARYYEQIDRRDFFKEKQHIQDYLKEKE